MAAPKKTTTVAPTKTVATPLSPRGMLMYDMAKAISVALVGGAPERYFVDIPDRAFDSASRLMEKIEGWDRKGKRKPEESAILINPVEEYIKEFGES